MSFQSMQLQVKAAPSQILPFTPVRTNLLQRKCACGGSPGADGECAECRRKRLALQTRSTNQTAPSTVPPIVHDVLRSAGQPLDQTTRNFMELRFGHDFSRVRVHKDAQAAESARAVNALAYSVGRDVVFGSGQYAPQTSEGRRLLAHELTHVVQNRNGLSGSSIEIGQPGDQYEQEADKVASSITHPQSSHIVGEQEEKRTLPAISNALRPKLRRVVSIPDGDVHFSVTKPPSVNAPTITPPNAVFTSNAIHMNGKARILGNPGDNCLGHTFGFLQTQWVETNRAYYRGQADRDGSIEVRRDRPPARPRAACSDTSIAGQVFTADPAETQHQVCNNLIDRTSIDDPGDAYPLIELNTLTGKNNFLREAHLEFLFATVFTVQHPDGTFRHLRSVYWNMRWQYRFTLTNFAAPGVAASWAAPTKLGGTGANFSGTIRGAPNDPRVPIFTVAQPSNCNTLVNTAILTAVLAGVAQVFANTAASVRQEKNTW
jgi:Domain of unknown function (DUF4157)